MSCTPGHGPDAAELDGHTHDHDGEHGEQAPAPAKVKRQRKRKGSTRKVARAHGHRVVPYAAAMGIPEVSQVVIRAAAGGNPWHALIGSAVVGAAAGTTAIVRTSDRAAKVKANAGWATAACTGWVALASTAGAVGPDGIVQWFLVAGASLFAARSVHLNNKEAKPVKPAEPAPTGTVERPKALPPADDPRLAAFKTTFVYPHNAPLNGANVTLQDIPDRGFTLLFYFPVDCKASRATVEQSGLLLDIAKFFDIAEEKVSGGHAAGDRSAARGQITVITAKDTSDKRRDWDGSTTFNPRAGTVAMGPFVDGPDAHYLLARPGSGAALGVFAGVIGGGKTGVMNKILADAGQAVMCVRCHAQGVEQGTCGACELERVVALFVGDPQKLPFGVWRGHADLTGWGPHGCVELLQFLSTAGTARAEVQGDLEWNDRGPDGQLRHNVGKDWFDLAPGAPLGLAAFDEWPLLVNHEDHDLAKESLACAVRAATTFRKIGIHFMFGVQILDLSQSGLREIREMAAALNAVAMRADSLTSSMGGIKGDPTKLDRNDPGAGYVAGYDNRPGTIFHSSFVPTQGSKIPGYRGVDIRHLAGVISSMPITFDPAMSDAMTAYDFTHRQVITEWKGRLLEGMNEAVEQVANATGGQAPMAADVDDPAQALALLMAGGHIAGQPAGPPVDLAAVKASLAKHPGDMYDVMERTGMNAGQAEEAMTTLITNGDLKSVGGDRFISADAA